MSAFVIWNGKLVHREEVIISPDNHSFKYGDGCFETIKIIDEQILLKDLHFQRFFSSLDTLKFNIPPFFTISYLSDLINQLIQANHVQKSARVRLVVYRGDGGLYDLENNDPDFIIQSFPATHSSNFYNKKGLFLDFYPDARKTSDRFSSIKSNNYLPYVMGAIWAKEKSLDDSIILNSYNRVAETTITNIFIVKDGIIKTPSLHEGCVNGVMRNFLLQSFTKENILFSEAEITPDEIIDASEVFLTNATYGIRWVQKVGEINYQNHTSSFLHQKFIVPLFKSATF